MAFLSYKKLLSNRKQGGEVNGYFGVRVSGCRGVGVSGRCPQRLFLRWRIGKTLLAKSRKGKYCVCYGTRTAPERIYLWSVENRGKPC